MCQIIKISETSNNGLIKYLLNNEKVIKESLKFKGGEGYSYTLFARENEACSPAKDIVTSEALDFKSCFNDLISNLIAYKDYINKTVVFFSRQKPEMENENVSLPPYQNEDKMVWMHGTIFNVPEIEEKYNIKVKVDSEILLYVDKYEIKGNYSAILFDKKSKFFNHIDNGLGLYDFMFDDVIIKTTDLYYEKRNTIKHFHRRYPNLIVSFSGGMDISLSTVKEIIDKIKHQEAYENIYLLYFDFGARAREQEIKTLDKMKNLIEDIYKKLLIEVNVETKVLDVRGMFKDISMIYNRNIKLLDENSKGDIKESESTLAYVPFRNTIFVELMGAFAEGKNLNNVKFLLGLNLSEGMIYGDNSEIWLDKINYLIKRAGREYHPGWEVTAPYYNRTKTNMIKDFEKEFNVDSLSEVLDISYSCYYPKEDGSPCGECGSCILRDKAIKLKETK